MREAHPIPEPRRRPSHDLWLYVVITCALSWGTMIPQIRGGEPVLGGPAGLLLMWIPGLVAVGFVLIRRERFFGTLGLNRFGGKQVALSYALPVAYCLVAYLPLWASGLGGFLKDGSVARIGLQLKDTLGLEGLSPFQTLAAYVLFIGTAGLLPAILAAFGEELGWRGYLQPKLNARFGERRGALLVGLIWAGWHYPGILFLGYNNGTGVASFLCFTAMITAMSVLMAHHRNVSGSVWPAVIFHAAHNVYVQQVFDRVTRDTGPTEYFSGEFGLALALVTAGFAAVVWRRLPPVALRSAVTPSLVAEPST